MNLYSLFTSVVKHGGYSKVTEKDLWETVSKDIGCPSACVNYSVALRRVYCQYLVAFENESYPHLKNDSLWSQIQDEFHENPGDVFTPPSVEKMLGIFNPKPAPIHYGMHRSATHLGFTGRDFYPTLRYNQVCDSHRLICAFTFGSNGTKNNYVLGFPGSLILRSASAIAAVGGVTFSATPRQLLCVASRLCLGDS